MSKFHLFVFDKKQSYEKIVRTSPFLRTELVLRKSSLITYRRNLSLDLPACSPNSRFTSEHELQNRIAARRDASALLRFYTLVPAHSYSSNRRQVIVVDNRLLSSTDAYPSKKNTLLSIFGTHSNVQQQFRSLHVVCAFLVGICEMDFDLR